MNTVNVIDENNNIVFEYEKSSRRIKIDDVNGLEIVFYGDNNKVTFYKNTDFRHCEFLLGNRIEVSIGKTNGFIKNFGIGARKAFNSKLIFGNDLTCVGASFNCRDSSNIIFGNDCMLSYNISIWSSDGHAIYDINSNKVINKSRDIIIGNHVWIGYSVTIFKGVVIGNNNIIGGRSCIRGKFYKENTVITGNPAIVIKDGVNWDRLSPYKYECLQNGNTI